MRTIIVMSHIPQVEFDDSVHFFITRQFLPEGVVLCFSHRPAGLEHFWIKILDQPANIFCFCII